MDRMKMLECMALEVGSGENLFTMTRGCFDYKQSACYRGRMEPEKKEDVKGGFDLYYREQGGRRHKIEVRRRTEGGAGELAAVKYAGSLPEDHDINRFRVFIPCARDEHFYGCGETYSKFDLKGEKVRIWVAEHQNIARTTKKMERQKEQGVDPFHVLPFDRYESYYAQPTFTSSARYFLHAFTDAYAEFDFSDESEIVLNLQEVPDFVIGEGDSFARVSEKLTGLLGRQRRLPDWVYDGVITAIQQGPEVIDRKLKQAKESGAKICGVWSQDWCGSRRNPFGYQVMWNWRYDRDLYPCLPEHIRRWKEEGVHFLGYINPFIALEREIYKEASEKGYCVKDKEGKDYLVTITVFPAAMIDFTNPAAYEWYKNLIKKNMIGIGMSGWMADFGEYLPTDAVLYDHSDPKLMHNRWPAIWARLNREAIDECGKGDEVFFFTRAGHTETVKYSTMMWTGDQHVDWSVDDGIPSVIPATLSLAMSGYGIAHSDAGGYTTNEGMKRSKELLLRWEEMNVFSPLWRSHEGNQPWNDVQFADDGEVLGQLSRCSKMHAALKPYLKALAEENEETGVPVMRPLFYHYDEEPAYTEKTEYLLGRDLLVAPVLSEGAVSRKVYLPEDEWVELFTGEVYGGGAEEVEAPIGRPPVFVRRQSPELKELLGIKVCE